MLPIHLKLLKLLLLRASILLFSEVPDTFCFIKISVGFWAGVEVTMNISVRGGGGGGPIIFERKPSPKLNYFGISIKYILGTPTRHFPSRIEFSK